MAAGNDLWPILPQSFESGTSTPDTRNGHAVRNFATGQTFICKIYIPHNYEAGGIDVELVWGAASATSGNGQWDVAFERVGETQDIDSDSFATLQSSGLVAVPATSGVMKKTVISFTNAQIAGLLAGEWGRLRITRNASGNHSGNSQLYGAVLRETPEA